MIIVALQDDVDWLYAIWNTVTDRFIGVNLGYNECIGIVADYENTSFERAKSRVDHPQPFSDIAKFLEDCEEDECEFCKKIYQPHNINNKPTIVYEKSCHSKNNKYYIAIPTDEGVEYSVDDIRFCPICGRKLSNK